MPDLLVLILPTFFVGLVLRACLLKVQEFRIWIWILSFGFMGASWWCSYLLVLYPREDFYFILAVHELCAVFLFGCACGFLVWFYSRRSGRLFNPKDVGHVPGPPHLMIFIRLLLAYGVAIFAAFHILIFIFLLIPGFFSGYYPPVFAMYERIMLNLPFLAKVSYGVGFPCLIAAHFLTLHLLQTYEKRLLFWVGLYLALSVVFGTLSITLLSPIYLNPHVISPQVHLTFLGMLITAPILTGAMMWLFTRSLTSGVSRISQYEFLPDRNLRSSVRAMGPLHLAGASILLLIVLSVPAVLTIHQPFQLFMLLIIFSKTLVFFCRNRRLSRGLGRTPFGGVARGICHFRHFLLVN